eukprot:9492806-Pyramimonas_sp.AAC.1
MECYVPKLRDKRFVMTRHGRVPGSFPQDTIFRVDTRGHNTGHPPLVASDFENVTPQLPLADLRKILDLPCELSVKIRRNRACRIPQTPASVRHYGSQAHKALHGRSNMHLHEPYMEI